MATPATQWRNIHKDVPLPSGNQADLRKPDLMAIIMTSKPGEIPNSLRGIVLSGIRNGGSVKAKWEMQEDELPAFYEMVSVICRAAFVSPRIVDEPDYAKNEISMDDVAMPDRIWVFQWGMPAEVGQAGTFPGGLKTGMGDAPGEQRIPDESGAVSGD